MEWSGAERSGEGEGEGRGLSELTNYIFDRLFYIENLFNNT